jgi:O-methyltransferase
LALFKDVLTGAAHEESAWRTLGAEAWAPGLGQWERWFKQRLDRALTRRGWVLARRLPYVAEDRRLGRDWPLVGYTMIGRLRLEQLQGCVETVLREGVAGDLMETGVWRGGACMWMKALLAAAGDNTRQVWLADSFAGLPAPAPGSSEWDVSDNPYLTVSAKEVSANFARFGLWDERVQLLEGWFADTLPIAPVERLAVLRLDGDLHDSTRVALDALYDKVSLGGFVIIDDYHCWAGCRQAVDTFRAERGLGDAMEEIDGTGVWWRKS